MSADWFCGPNIPVYTRYLAIGCELIFNNVEFSKEFTVCSTNPPAQGFFNLIDDAFAGGSVSEFRELSEEGLERMKDEG
jgi:hypothetical protein